MVKINPYLNFNGNTEEAFNFYKSVFGGEFLAVHRFKDAPGSEEMKPADQEKIMHIALSIGGNILMGTDVMPPMSPATHGTGISISIDAESEAEASQVFENLSAGGEIAMPLEKMFWGALFGMLTDQYGIQWMVNYDGQKK
ncbi:PhnB protein [Pedobacter psychrotolerans]|uniref:PhnB protein n=1 Tax=Pedobacter psychrotolerans TaxID=1843235 RepID=A0A4R2HM78_9SPHI|nr:VOC family protein [Pedobacter psychrotolerans]TCO31327.1 PhnB protein [Pedobacter psychrotolerans]GGE40539.1 VOC family protein [Pedobacter psychrotolerans]